DGPAGEIALPPRSEIQALVAARAEAVGRVTVGRIAHSFQWRGNECVVENSDLTALRAEGPAANEGPPLPDLGDSFPLPRVHARVAEKGAVVSDEACAATRRRFEDADTQFAARVLQFVVRGGERQPIVENAGFDAELILLGGRLLGDGRGA